jgi:pimeloyl-ACP methyl ester carboxylesterase
VRAVSRTRYADNDSLKIAYEVHGAMHRRRPWLVLIQGLGFDHSGWDPVEARLRRRFRLLLVDNRGCGGSDASPRAFSVSDLARDVIAVMDAAVVPRAHVAGSSLGGMVAQELAIAHAERVDGLVLACTTPGWPNGYGAPRETMRLMAASRNLPYEEALRRHVENALSARTMAERPELAEQIIEHQRPRRFDESAWYSLAAAGGRYYGGTRQHQIRAPTLVLQGTADTVVDPRNARLLADRIPGARLVLLPDLGHLFFWEDPKAFTQPVVEFLRDLPGDGRDLAAPTAGGVPLG